MNQALTVSVEKPSAGVSSKVINGFKNLSVLTQMSVLVVSLILCWLLASIVFVKQVVEVQLINQAKVMVDTAELLQEHVSKYNRFWIKSSDYSGKWIDRVPQDDGSTFYSMNPAMFLSEFSRAFEKDGLNARYKITSLDPMNPYNAPTKAEKEIMEEIQVSLSKESKHRHVGNTFQYIKPLYFSESCISCHGDVSNAPESVRLLYGTDKGYGYKAGDFAGAISATLPVDTLGLLAGVFDYSLVLLYVVPITLLFAFIIFLVRFISRLSYALSHYRRTDPVNIDYRQVSDNTRNELFILWRTCGEKMELLKSTYEQLESAQSQIKPKQSPQNKPGERHV
jgi:hypothetical protein